MFQINATIDIFLPNADAGRRTDSVAEMSECGLLSVNVQYDDPSSILVLTLDGTHFPMGTIGLTKIFNFRDIYPAIFMTLCNYVFQVKSATVRIVRSVTYGKSTERKKLSLFLLRGRRCRIFHCIV